MKPSPYRWTILVVYMLVTLTIEIQWLTHASVVRPAEKFYSGQYNSSSIFNIDFLAMSYMFLFLIMSFPASYAIDKFGIKKSLSAGAAIAAVSSLCKAVFSGNFTGVLISQLGLAIAQPFILNSVTAVTARWFPISERAMAAGLSALAQYLGIIIAMLITPLMIGSNPDMADYGTGFSFMMWIYGIATVISSLSLILLIREHPEGYHESDGDERSAFGKGIIDILKNRDMKITLFLFLIGLGIFNAISSMTDSISAHAGIKDSNGLIGGLMLIGGIAGAIIIPSLSDKYLKRKAFLVICISGMVPGVAGLAFAGDIGLSPSATYTVMLVSSFILGFFVMSAGPVGFQYAAEVSSPAPESASQGMLLWIGQLSGIIFVAGMSAGKNAHLAGFMHLFAALTIVSLLAVLFLRESESIKASRRSREGQ